MKLTSYEQAMLDGAHGEARRVAMAGLVQLGEAFGAADMVEIGYAHIHAGMALYLHDVDLMEELAAMGAKMAVPASSNIANADFNSGIAGYAAFPCNARHRHHAWCSVWSTPSTRTTASASEQVPVPGISAEAGTPPFTSASRSRRFSPTDIEFASLLVPNTASPAQPDLSSQRQCRTKRSASGE